MFGYTSCPSDGLQNGLATYVEPWGSVVYVLWHMFGSFVLLRGLDAVVATASAEEMEEAFAVPLEPAVAFAIVSVAAVGADADAVAATTVSRPEASESPGFSAEKSSAKRFVSPEYVIEATTLRSTGTYQPAADRAKLQT